MAGLIKVTPEQLQQVSAQLGNGAASIDATNAQLRSSVAPLGSDWAGQAQARFHALWEQWERSARQLNEALQGISQLMNQAGASYADNESAIASTFGR